MNEKRNKNNGEEAIRKSIDIHFDNEESEIPIINKTKEYEIHNIKMKENVPKKINNKEFIILNNFQKELKNNYESTIKKKDNENENYFHQKKYVDEKNNHLNDAEFKIPIRKKNNQSDYLNGHFYKNRPKKEYEDDKAINLLDIFKYKDFPVNIINEKKRKTKNIDKIVIEFLDSYNDDFVKKNMNNNVIFESIEVCKGVSFLHINENINISCIGSKYDNIFYFYKMIPFDKLYSKSTINKILSKKDVSKKEDLKQTDTKISNLNHAHQNYFLKNYNILKNYFFKNKKKKTLYNDLYLLPYEKNLKSSICIGKNIYSKERAVKKCFGLLIEQNVYNVDQPQEDNTTANKNLENLDFNFLFDKNQIILKPIYYPYKNIKINSNSLQNYLRDINWASMNHLKDAQFYNDIKKNLFTFSKDFYLTTKSAIKHFNSPMEFIVQTTRKMQDINIQIKKICEKSIYIAHDSIIKLYKASKAS